MSPTRNEKRRTPQFKGSKKKRNPSLLTGLPSKESSLTQAYRLTTKVSKVGFDWPNMKGVLKKLDEELGEFRRALRLKDRKTISDELGDLLFVLVNVARVLQIHPEKALRRTIQKFISRFRYVERALHRKGKSLKQSNLSEMDHLWEEAKRRKAKAEWKD